MPSAPLLAVALAAARFPRRVAGTEAITAGDLARLATCFPAMLAVELGPFAELAATDRALGAALRGLIARDFAPGGDPAELLARRLGIDPAAGMLAALALPALGRLRRAELAGLAGLDAAGAGPVPLSRLLRLFVFAVRVRRPDLLEDTDGTVGAVFDWTLLHGLAEFKLWHLLPTGDRTLLFSGSPAQPPLFLRAAMRFRADLRAHAQAPMVLREWLRRSASGEYGIDLAGHPPAHPRPGRLSVIGPWRQVLGLSDDCHSVCRALDALGTDYEVLATRPTPRIEIDRDKDRALRHRAVDTPSGERALFSDTLFEATFWALAHWPRFRGFTRADLFAPWELPALPPGWPGATALFDTILTPSHFTAGVFAAAGAARVRRLCPSIELTGRGRAAAAAALRRRLVLPREARVFACVFDFSSVMERKNPAAAIVAFRRLRVQVPRAVLVLKTTRGHRNPAAVGRLRALIGSDRGILWADAAWPNLAVEGLLRRADALISLHRAEGFGRNIAKALRLGGRAVVTDWSGNTDLRAERGYIGVGHRLRRLRAGEYFLGLGQEWAEPDLADAARALRRALASPAAPYPARSAHRFSRVRFARRLGRELGRPGP